MKRQDLFYYRRQANQYSFGVGSSFALLIMGLAIILAVLVLVFVAGADPNTAIKQLIRALHPI